jgi:hypothetical protein
MSFHIAQSSQERRARMFYKSSSRSTVLERHQSVRNDPVNPIDDEVNETRLIEAQRRSEALGNHKLSTFEKELLQAWWQD